MAQHSAVNSIAVKSLQRTDMQPAHCGSSTKMTTSFKTLVNAASKALLQNAAHLSTTHDSFDSSMAQHSTAQHSTGRALLFKPFWEAAPEALPGDLLSAKAAIGLQQG